MKLRTYKAFRIYTQVLGAFAYLAMYFGLRTLSNWDPSIPAILVTFALSLWLAPKVAIWAALDLFEPPRRDRD